MNRCAQDAGSVSVYVQQEQQHCLIRHASPSIDASAVEYASLYAGRERLSRYRLKRCKKTFPCLLQPPQESLEAPPGSAEAISLAIPDGWAEGADAE